MNRHHHGHHHYRWKTIPDLSTFAVDVFPDPLLSAIKEWSRNSLLSAIKEWSRNSLFHSFVF
jgi:hypothetical protein